MESLLSFKNASSVSLDELAADFNAGFAGYFYPPMMTAETLSRRARMEHIDLQQSILAYDGEEYVGFCLFGLRGRDGWCGGFGIVPAYRGRGLAHHLMAELVARARACGVKRLSLELLTRNTAARRLYERAGMKVTRDLLIFERSRDEDCSSYRTIELQGAEPDVLLRDFERLHAWRPAWQREFAALLSADGILGVCLRDDQTVGAYALLVTRPDGITQVLDLAASNEEQANELCAGIARRFCALRVVNEPEESLFNGALTAHGFIEVDRQHEMHMSLSQ